MLYPELFRMLVLYVHLMAFCITVSAVVIEDFRLIIKGYSPANLDQLQATARIVLPGTVVLLITGLCLCAIDTQMNWDIIQTRPKLLAKLTVVGILVVNGILLHFLAFPALQRKSATPVRTALMLCGMGALSSVSWLYASFLGIAKALATHFQWLDFMFLYALLVVLAFTGAILLTGPQLMAYLRPRSKRALDKAARNKPSEDLVPRRRESDGLIAPKRTGGALAG